VLDLLQHYEIHEINAFYAEMFCFFISRGLLTPKVACGNLFSDQREFTMLESEVFKYNSVNFYIAKTMLLLKFLQVTSNKQ